MPLTGIRVIDWTVFMQGPLASECLGSLGADVIKIEHPVTGDLTRGSLRQFGVPQSTPDGRASVWESHNRSKRGMAIDLKKPRGREIVLRLVEHADVFVQNHRKGVAERLGLDYETLSAINPMLIYAQGWGVGPKGPDSGLPIMDTIAQARSGLLLQGAASSADESVTPLQPIVAAADDIGALGLALGIMTALLVRERRGIGQKVDASLLGSVMRVIRQQIAGYYLTGVLTPPPRRERMPNPLFNQYKCQDGKWLRIAITRSDRYWTGFCRAIGRPDIEHDPRFTDSLQREKYSPELIAILDEVLATKTYDEWDARFREEDLIFGPIKSIPDLVNDPQVTENRYLVDFDDPVVGKIKVPGLPFDLSKTPWAIRTPSPQLGQHNEEILVDELGYTWDEVQELKAEAVIP